MSEETVRLNDRISVLERDREILLERLEMAAKHNRYLETAKLSIGSIIKKSEDADEMLMILRTYPTDNGLVVEVQ